MGKLHPTVGAERGRWLRSGHYDGGQLRSVWASMFGNQCVGRTLQYQHIDVRLALQVRLLELQAASGTSDRRRLRSGIGDRRDQLRRLREGLRSQWCGYAFLLGRSLQFVVHKRARQLQATDISHGGRRLRN
jgi:hypothetical protein